MCRLLGVIANQPVDLEFSLERFKKYGNCNPDGWGIGWYESNESKVFKQGIAATSTESKLPVFSKSVRSKIIIVHVRKGTGAVASDQNSHPFKYKNWIFAHNGCVNKEYLLPLLTDEFKEKLEGETDSEVYFYWLLQCIDKEQDTVKGIKRVIESVVKRNYSGLNFLLSDGNNLYAFRYSNNSRDYYSLYNLKRDPSERGSIKLFSKETKAIIHSKSLKGEDAVLVCSEKLTDEKWEKIRFGNLLIIESKLKMNVVEIR